MIKIFADGKELRNFEITSKENEGAHNGLTYGGKLQNALDFSILKNAEISLNKDCVVTTAVDGKLMIGKADYGHYIVVQCEDWMLMFGHTYKMAPLRKTVKAGDTICWVAPMGQNGGYYKDGKWHDYFEHLHCMGQYKGQSAYIRDIIFATEETESQDWEAKYKELELQNIALNNKIEAAKKALSE